MTVLFFLLLLAAAGVVMGRRSGRVIVAVAIAAMFVWGSDVAASRFAGLLERGFAAGAPAGDADAIVVLGASTYPPDDTQPEILPGYGTYLRCHHAARLYRTWKALPVVATGGPGGGRGGGGGGAGAVGAGRERGGGPPG